MMLFLIKVDSNSPYNAQNAYSDCTLCTKIQQKQSVADMAEQATQEIMMPSLWATNADPRRPAMEVADDTASAQNPVDAGVCRTT